MWLGMPRIWSGLSPSCTGHSCELGDGAAKLPTRSSQPCPSEPHTAALWPGWFFQRSIQGAQSDLKGREQARSWLHRGAVKAVPRTGAVAGHRSRPKENQAGCSQTWAVPHCPTPGAAETLQIFVCKLCGRAALPWHFLQLCFTPTDIEQPAWRAGMGEGPCWGSREVLVGRRLSEENRKVASGKGSSLHTGRLFLIRACLDWSHPHCTSTSTPRSQPGASCCSQQDRGAALTACGQELTLGLPIPSPKGVGGFQGAASQHPSFLRSSQKALCPQAPQPGHVTCPQHSPWAAEGHRSLFQGSQLPRCLPSTPAAGAAKGAAGTERHFFQEPLPAFPPPSQSRAAMLGSAGGSWVRAKAVPGWTWLGWVLEPHIFSSVQRGAWSKHSPCECDTSQASQARSTWLEGAAAPTSPGQAPLFPVQLGEWLSSPDSPHLHLRGFRHLSLGKGNPKHLSPSTPRSIHEKKRTGLTQTFFKDDLI